MTLGIGAAAALQQVKSRQPGSFDTFNGTHGAVNLRRCSVDGQDDRSAGTAQSAGSDRRCLGATEDAHGVDFIDFSSQGNRYRNHTAADDIVSIRKRTSIRVNPDFRHEEARVVIYLENGTTFEAHIPHASGTPQNPVTDENLSCKYMRMAEKVIGADKAKMLAEKIWAADKIDNFQNLVALTTPV